MAIDEWRIPIQPARRLKQDVAILRNGTATNFGDLSRKINDLQIQVTELTNAINILVSMIKKEVSGSLEKKQLPPPPIPPRMF